MDGIEIIAPTLAAGIVVGAALAGVWLRKRYRRNIDAAGSRQRSVVPNQRLRRWARAR